MYILRSLAIFTLSLLIVAAAGLTVLRLKGAQLLSVQTASMEPTFRPGDALIVARASYLGVKPGQIVSYRSPRNPNIVISHRLVKVDSQTGWLTTQGDAYQQPDPSFPPNLLMGRATLLLPGLGPAINVLHKPMGLALALYLPALTVIALEARQLASAYARPLYSVRL